MKDSTAPNRDTEEDQNYGGNDSALEQNKDSVDESEEAMPCIYEDENIQISDTEQEEQIEIKDNAQLIEEISRLRNENIQLRQNLEEEKLLRSKPNADLIVEVTRLKSENNQLKQDLEKEKNKCIDILKRHFSEGVVRKMTSSNPNQQIHWSKDDIASAISLRATGSKTYDFMRNTMGLPLPSLRTLRRWAKERLDLSEGILSGILEMMQLKGNSLGDRDKSCILAFDEMSISPEICIDKADEKVLGPHTKVQTVIARGLFNGWRQIVFYQYDTRMTEEILFNLIRRISNIGFRVVATTCDMGPENRRLRKDLGVSRNRPFFSLPESPKENVFFFHDPPHLLKCIRNHFIDTGYRLNGQTISKRQLLIIKRILTNPENGDLRMSPKLEDDLFLVDNIKRQNVGKAAKLLSHTNGAVVEYFGSRGLLDEEESYKALENFLYLCNNWFDLFNTTDRFESYNGAEEQDNILNEMTEMMTHLRIITPRLDHKDSAILPFQEGIIISNNALKGLFRQLKGQYSNVQYLMTKRLNQDNVENFFSYIRAMGRGNDAPDPLSFKWRLRWYILGKNSTDLFSTNLNTQADQMNKTALVAMPDPTPIKKIPLTEQLMNAIIDGVPLTEDILTDLADEELLEPDSLFTDIYNEPAIDDNDLETVSNEYYDEARKNLAGYVAYRFKKVHPELGSYADTDKTSDWIATRSKGYLKRATKELEYAIKITDEEFLKYHGPTSLSREKNIFKNVLERVKIRMGSELKVTDKVLLCYIRTRTFIRLRNWNKTKPKKKEVEEQEMKKKKNKLSRLNKGWDKNTTQNEDNKENRKPKKRKIDDRKKEEERGEESGPPTKKEIIKLR